MFSVVSYYSLFILDWFNSSSNIYSLPNYYGKPIQFFVNVTQHLGAPFDKKDHRESTYSVKINPIFAFLYWDMQYHLEHHMFPTIPSYNFKKIKSPY